MRLKKLRLYLIFERTREREKERTESGGEWLANTPMAITLARVQSKTQALTGTHQHSTALASTYAHLHALLL